MRSRFLAMNSRCVHGVMLRASSIMYVISSRKIAVYRSSVTRSDRQTSAARSASPWPTASITVLRFCCTMRCHVGQGGEAERQCVLRQYDAALGRVGGVVADPLQVAGDLQRGDDLAQVVGNRLAQGKQADDERLHPALQLVDLGVELDRARRGGGVAFHHRLGREPRWECFRP